MDGGGQLLSLKVMRVSRPSLGSAWEPFYSSSPSLSAHSTASITSLQGKTPLPGHPKTLRDLTHITELLTLPSSFGAIQLGETFSSCLSVNNEANVDVEGVIVHVEMQTASTKTLLAEFGGPEQRLGVGQSLEKIVSHEIKELGQHVLGCTVSYRMPPGVRPPPGQSADLQDPSVESFRKFYKFAVTNPLSVKTKVHLPRSPTALLSSEEREKVLLEVHIQNLTQDAMWLERMQFDCVDGWQAQDANYLEDAAAGSKESLFTGSTALMQPQDVRQYIYILQPINLPPFPITHAPGAILALGRLDISWRSSFGEPGRLLTSTLSRRIPLIQPPSNPQTPPPGLKQPPSAIPLHLQRSNTIGGSPSRAQSPLPPQRAMSPPANQPAPAPYRPGSPFRGRPPSVGPPARNQTQSPGPPTSVAPPPRLPEDVEVDLVVTSIPRDSLAIDKPFDVAFKVTVQAPAPFPRPNESRRQRVLSLVVQHTQAAKEISVAAAVASAVATTPGPSNQQGSWTPRVPSSGFSTPSPYATPFRADFPDTLSQRLLVASPRQLHAGELESDGGDTPGPNTHTVGRVYDLPSPELRLASGAADPKASRSDGVSFLGTSTLFLPALRLPVPSLLPAAAQPRTSGHTRDVSDSSVESESENEPLAAPERLRVTASQEFELTYVPRKSGFLTIGGLRVLVVEDRLAEEDDHADGAVLPIEPRILKEWEVVAEVWVTS
ncbi:hypothetical protein DICSQDRAFT_160869 [Dichomitus squalens LYAD-421 SS1]|uniref:uncharacterized protein n=1 Tax=Dichomitus squalens (strain LYAD-421) TaxID=732165 RepID=UPI0004410984|nr:uncharacterized protein DICSQDRAFT_160869 [Dichomitus squalens LYAD-421 SS1]EJF62442.1 hypothetical protein DICSQDRAFT_160869 [Dichomitus squalens LYAD-421 SS1]